MSENYIENVSIAIMFAMKSHAVMSYPHFLWRKRMNNSLNFVSD